MKNRVVLYIYVRVSTRKQNPARQYRNMETYCRENGLKMTKAYEDKFTGTTTDRPEFRKLKKKVDEDLAAGKEVTIVFDSVSRMSRNAEEGIKQYFEWFDQGVNLVFINERHIDTQAYKDAINAAGFQIEADNTAEGELVSDIVTALNKFMRSKVRADIIKAFEQAEKEARDIKKRVIEGLEASDKKGGRPVIEDGDRVETQKAKKAKDYIKAHCKRYGGELNDSQCIKCADISRPTFYKYLKEIEEDAQKGATA